MDALDTTLHSIGNLLRRKTRTVLTSTGVAVAVAALVLLLSLAMGVKTTVFNQMQAETMLTTIVVNRPLDKSPTKRNNPFPSMGRQDSDPLSDADIAELSAIDGVLRAYPDFGLFLHTYPIADNDEHHFPLWICGIPEDECRDMEAALLAGSFWKQGETDAIVLPSVAAEMAEVKDPATLVGTTIRLKRKSKDEAETFRIVGVADSSKLGIRANQVLMPLSVCRELWIKTKGGIWSAYDPDDVGYPRAFVRVSAPDKIERTKTIIRNSGYQAISVSDMLKALEDIFAIVRALMMFIGALGFVVGFFGIANTMAMCVLERTREIGIMKAVGGTHGTILGLFLIEAAGLGWLGGLLGLTAAWLLGLALNALAHPMFDLKVGDTLFQTTPLIGLGAVGFSIVVSMLAGLLPAMRAARMRPVEALRYE